LLQHLWMSNWTACSIRCLHARQPMLGPPMHRCLYLEACQAAVGGSLRYLDVALAARARAVSSREAPVPRVPFMISAADRHCFACNLSHRPPTGCSPLCLTYSKQHRHTLATASNARPQFHPSGLPTSKTRSRHIPPSCRQASAGLQSQTEHSRRLPSCRRITAYPHSRPRRFR